MRKIKLATLVTKLGGGGGERVATTLTRCFGEKYEQDIIAHVHIDKAYPYHGRLLTTHLTSNRSNIGKMWKAIQRLLAVKRIKRTQSYDICISHLYSSNLINALSSTNDKTILVIHGETSLRVNWPPRWITSIIYRKADAVVGISKHYQRQAISELNLDPKKVHCINNPIQVSEIREQAKAPLDSLVEQKIFEQRVFIYVGRLSEEKGQAHSIRAFSKVAQKIPDARLVFLGEGSEKEKAYLHSLVIGLELENRVFFLGLKQNPFRYLQRAFALFYTSLRDGLPMVLLEALACETPIISADCDSGPREILAPKSPFSHRTTKLEIADYGILCPVCDGKRYTPSQSISRSENLFAEAAVMLAEDEQLHSKFKATSLGRAEDYNSSKIVMQYDELIHTLLNKD
jgi:glycosyltransferase involved in cell wall biosynthesis